MRYYRVRDDCDQKAVSDSEICCVFSGELFTKEEIIAYDIPLKYVKAVDIPEERTYWSFGTRRDSAEEV